MPGVKPGATSAETREAVPRVKASGTCSIVAAALTLAPIFGAPQKEASAAPVPAEMLAARKVFISNVGRGCSPFGRPEFTGGPERPYNQFYAAMKSWGRYEVASSPAAADLDFEISLSCPAAGANVFKGQSYSTIYDPQLRLVILDVKTHTALWAITEHVRPALFQANHDKSFDRAMAALVEDLKGLIGQPAATPAGAVSRRLGQKKSS